MKRAVLAVALVAACGKSDFSEDAAPNDAASGATCGTYLTIDPPVPIAGPSTTIRATAGTGRPGGVASYRWLVDRDGAFSVDSAPATPDDSSIEFAADTAGVYHVRVSVTISGEVCEDATQAVTVGPANSHQVFLRLRVVPPLRIAAPPLDRLLPLAGGAAADLGNIAIDPGTPVAAAVTGPGGTGVPAYVRFAPAGAPEAFVEAFADTAGQVAVNLVPQPYSVLVVPSQGGLAPRRFTAWSAVAPTPLAVDAGITVHGVIRDPGNAAVAGATVQLTIDGVPSTVATSDAGGNFTLQVASTSGELTLEVTPPVASGLPRLTATAAFDVRAALQVRYATGLVRRSLAGVIVKRAGQPVAGARVVVVGTLASAGTVTAGVQGVAAGEVRIAATTDPDGALPAALIPAGALAAVISVAPGDLAVALLDTRAAVPATLAAPALPPSTSALRGPLGALPGAVMDLVPIGALALADAPAIHLVADAAGAVTAALPVGGHYDLRLRDPAARAAPRVVRDVTALDASYALGAAIELRGTVRLGNLGPLAGASVQILCQDCTGVDRAKPIAEVAADPGGGFRLAVPDPGTM